MTVCKLGMDHEWKLVLRKETNSEPLGLPFSGIQFDWVWLILIALMLCVRLLVQPQHCILRLELMPMGRASHVSTRQPRLAATREINVHSAICPMRQIRAQWPEEFVNIHVTALKKECLSWKLSETFNLFSLIKLWPVTYFSAILYNRTTVMSCSGNSHLWATRAMWHAHACSMGEPPFWWCNCQPHFWGSEPSNCAWKRRSFATHNSPKVLRLLRPAVDRDAVHKDLQAEAERHPFGRKLIIKFLDDPPEEHQNTSYQEQRLHLWSVFFAGT